MQAKLGYITYKRSVTVHFLHVLFPLLFMDSHIVHSTLSTQLGYDTVSLGCPLEFQFSFFVIANLQI